MKHSSKANPAVVVGMVLTGLAFVFSPGQARAAFHLWAVSEVYSSPDGSVQYVELSTPSSGQNFLGGVQITCTGPQGVQSFTFPSNLNTSISTANKHFIIGTSNLASVPGGVTPDYVLTNTTPFLSLNGTNTVVVVGTVTTPLTYTNLPTDGRSALAGTGSSLNLVTNVPINFSNQTNSIVPVAFSSVAAIDGDFVMTFPTATGVNGALGPNYTVQFLTDLSGLGWAPFASVPGDGTSKSVSNALSSAATRFFRLSAP